jgi:glycosyltransferase involved in cell wall biosynthesis
MKKISVVIPCYNDSNSIAQMRKRLKRVFSESLPDYDYEIIYVDDCSPDNTWEEIQKVCVTDNKCKGIRNIRNFGFARNSFSALTYGNGDATFFLYGDMQDPPEYLPELVSHWENGHMVVVGARMNSYTGKFLSFLRNFYYNTMEKLTNKKIVKGVAFYGLYDKSFIDILDKIEDVQPVINGIIGEYAGNVKLVNIMQEKGGRGKSNINFWGRYDLAMVNLTSYSKMLLRTVTFIGAFFGFLSIAFSLFVFVFKLLNWDAYSVGIPALTCGVFFLGGMQLFFLGIIGEYVLSINNRSMKRPLTVIAERLNFDD